RSNLSSLLMKYGIHPHRRLPSDLIEGDSINYSVISSDKPRKQRRDQRCGTVFVPDLSRCQEFFFRVAQSANQQLHGRWWILSNNERPSLLIALSSYRLIF